MAGTSRFSAFPVAFTIIFAIAYVIAVEKNLALFTYHPALGEWGPLVQAPKDGPAMYWYGWLATAGLTALIAGFVTCLLPRPATLFWTGWTWAIPLGVMLIFVWILRGFFLL